MVRTGYLIAGIAAVASVVANPALAQDRSSIDWFTGLKRAAKDLRIAAGKSDTSGIVAARRNAHSSAFAIGMWPATLQNKNFRTICGNAANTLLSAAKYAEQGQLRQFDIDFNNYETRENLCFGALVR